jgi:hypothetical protein
MRVTDNRTSTSQVGLVYAADYSTNFVERSLVDKAMLMLLLVTQQ